jgi:hypothetical protein
MSRIADSTAHAVAHRWGSLSAAVVLIVAGAAIFRTAPTVATSHDMGRFRTQYPSIVGTRLDSCQVCHPAGHWTLNPFGTDYANAGGDFAAIEGRDSDGDGYSNMVEIPALTFPGDANDHPTGTPPTPTATASAAPSPTPSPTSTLPPTATSTPIATPTSEGTTAPSPAYVPWVGRNALSGG